MRLESSSIKVETWERGTMRKGERNGNCFAQRRSGCQEIEQPPFSRERKLPPAAGGVALRLVRKGRENVC